MAKEIQSSIISKSVRVLDIISRRKQPPSFTEIVSETCLPKSSVHRLLAILEGEGLIEFDDRQKVFRFGSKLQTWARQAWENTDLQQQAEGEMQRLAEISGHNVALAVLSSTSVLYLRTIDSYPVRYAPKMGEHSPIHCSAVGKVLVTHTSPEQRSLILQNMRFEQHTPHTITSRKAFEKQLDAVALSGYARNDSENFIQTNGIAAPIFDYRGDVIAALSLWGLIKNLDSRSIDEWIPELRKTTNTISQRIGYQKT